METLVKTLTENFVLDDPIGKSEYDFYSAHSWCLNPVLTLKDLFERFGDELDQYGTWDHSWHREECRINFYLFASAIDCIVSDYVFRKPWDMSKTSTLIPQSALLSETIFQLSGLPFNITSRIKFGKLTAWKSNWEAYLDKTCGILLRDSEPTAEVIDELKAGLAASVQFDFPLDLLKQRMKIMEGYRRQDLTHHDVVTMTNRFIETCPDTKTKVVVIGPRTAGSYFAPIAKAHLQMKGYADVSCLTLRPKKGLFPAERKRLKNLLTPDSRLILIDDYSNTGLTFRMLQKMLGGFQISPDRIILLAPVHPKKPVVRFTDDTRVKVITLEHNDLFKSRLLEHHSAGKIINQYARAFDSSELEIEDDPQLEAVNSAFRSHYKESFQARLKRVYRVGHPLQPSADLANQILAKSVGWGWLGYHAYLIARRTRGFVAPLAGLRNGILYTEWIDGQHLSRADLTDYQLKKIGEYVAIRSKSLQMLEDPRFEVSDIHSGWQELITILKRPYVRPTGFLKQEFLLNSLKGCVCKSPSVVDGNMSPQEWILQDGEIIKTDFEHHNFGEPELEVVDPAFDLAATSYEFQLSNEEEDLLVTAYSNRSGDDTIRDRLFLYKLLYNSYMMKTTHSRMLEGAARNELLEMNARLIRSWNSLVFNMNSLSARLLGGSPAESTGRRLFFMDIDDVFDSYVLGFPHTTLNGLNAVSLLKHNGFTIVPNTGRSSEHVRNYCREYGFPYGVAEYGSAFFDAAEGIEIPLISEVAQGQLLECRSVIADMEGVYIDPSYHYGVRAYRISGRGTMPMSVESAQQLIKEKAYDRVGFITRDDATYFVSKRSNKGTALEYVRDYLGCSPAETAAIGDSDEDIPMLLKAGIGFAPENCSARIRTLSHSRECTIVRGRRQRGLYNAVISLVKNLGIKRKEELLPRQEPGTLGYLMLSIMTRSEQSRTRRLAALLNPNKL